MSHSTTLTSPFTVTGPTPTQPMISNYPPPGATLGQAYSYQLLGTGGVLPYVFSATGLPAGLTISSTGLISGTPTVAGVFPSLSITIADSSN